MNLFDQVLLSLDRYNEARKGLTMAKVYASHPRPSSRSGGKELRLARRALAVAKGNLDRSLRAYIRRAAAEPQEAVRTSV